MLCFQNKCVACLPDEIADAIRPRLTLRALSKGARLTDLVSEETLVFPITSVIAMTAALIDQSGSLLKFIGPNDVIGVAPRNSSRAVQYEGICCNSGYAFVGCADDLWAFLESPESLHACHLKFSSAISKRALLRAYCASNHSLSQRLAAMLLEAEDAFGRSSTISLSQKDISRWMFVRRESIAGFLATWAAVGAIETAYSRLTIRDRDFLVSTACACYQNSLSLSAAESDSWAALSWKRNSSFAGN